jgi:hypothetical protein
MTFHANVAATVEQVRSGVTRVRHIVMISSLNQGRVDLTQSPTRQVKGKEIKVMKIKYNYYNNIDNSNSTINKIIKIEL